MICSICKQDKKDTSWLYSALRNGWICSSHFMESSKPEFVPERIRDDRREYFHTVVQPFRGGELSREYIENYGTKGINVTEKQMKKAKYVWKDLDGWNTRKRGTNEEGAI